MALLFRCFFCSQHFNEAFITVMPNDDDLLHCEKCTKIVQSMGGKKTGAMAGLVSVKHQPTTN